GPFDRRRPGTDGRADRRAEQVARPMRPEAATRPRCSMYMMRGFTSAPDRAGDPTTWRSAAARSAVRCKRELRASTHALRSTTVTGALPTDHRCCWTGTRNRVCMTVNELPASALQSKHTGHADRYWCFLLGTPD